MENTIDTFGGAPSFMTQTGSRPQVLTNQPSTGFPGTMPDGFASIKPELLDNLNGSANEAGAFSWATSGRECDGCDMTDARQSLIGSYGPSGTSPFYPGSGSMDGSSQSQVPAFDTMDFDRFTEALDSSKFELLLRSLPSAAKQPSNTFNDAAALDTCNTASCGTGNQGNLSLIGSMSFDAQFNSLISGDDSQATRTSVSLPTPSQLRAPSLDPKLALDYNGILDAWDLGQQLFQRVSDTGDSVDETFENFKLPNVSKPAGIAEKKVLSAPSKANRGIGPYTELARPRWLQLSRYREKKKHRAYNRQVRYGLRKANADNRPRIKGRFVKGLGPGDMPVGPAQAPKPKIEIEG